MFFLLIFFQTSFTDKMSSWSLFQTTVLGTKLAHITTPLNPPGELKAQKDLSSSNTLTHNFL